MTKHAYIDALKEQLASLTEDTPYARGARDALKMALEMAGELRASRRPKDRVVSLDKWECATCAYALTKLEPSKGVRELTAKLSVWRDF